MPGFMKTQETGFKIFFETAVTKNPLGAEYLLPIFIGQLLRKNRIKVKVFRTDDKWFGVDFQGDKPLVLRSIRKLIQESIY